MYRVNNKWGVGTYSGHYSVCQPCCRILHSLLSAHISGQCERMFKLGSSMARSVRIDCSDLSVLILLCREHREQHPIQRRKVRLSLFVILKGVSEQLCILYGTYSITITLRMYCWLYRILPSKRPWVLEFHRLKMGVGAYTEKPFVRITYIHVKNIYM